MAYTDVDYVVLVTPSDHDTNAQYFEANLMNLTVQNSLTINANVIIIKFKVTFGFSVKWMNN